MTEQEFLEVYGKGLSEPDKSPSKRLVENPSNKAWEDGAERDEKGRYIDSRHDDEEHNYYDYNDYKFVDEELETCGTEVNWVALGKVGTPKQ
jgi:hypothetical protein